MNDVDLLAAALERDPLNTIVAAMLTDELCEARDMLPAEAARHVARVVGAGCLRAELERAAELLAVGSADRDALLLDVSAELGFLDLADVLLVVVAGDQPPTLTTAAPTSPRSFWPSRSCLVGAGWLLSIPCHRSRYNVGTHSVSSALI